jgi:hypothetical protein
MDGLIEPVGSPPNTGLLLQYDTIVTPLLRSSVNLWPPCADAEALADATEIAEAVLAALADKGVLGHVNITLERRPPRRRQPDDAQAPLCYVVTEVTVGISDAVAGAFHIGALLGRRIDAEAESAANPEEAMGAGSVETYATRIAVAKGDIAAAGASAKEAAATARRRSSVWAEGNATAASSGARRRSSLYLSPFHLAWSSDLLNSALAAIHAGVLLKLAR